MKSQGELDPASGLWSTTLTIVAFLLVLSGASLYSIGRLKDHAVALAAAGEPLSPAKLISVFGLGDAIIALVLFALALWLLRSEWRDRAITRLLREMSPWQSIVLLTAIVVWLGHCYAFSGVLLGGDTGSHIARFLEIRRGLDAGVLPQWTNYQYLGSPLLGFTGPLTYIVGGVIDTVVRNAVTTAKILLFSTHLLTGWLFYAYLRRLNFSALAAIVAATTFIGSFARLHLFLFKGVLPQGLTILFFVLVFYAAEGLMRRRLPDSPTKSRYFDQDWLFFALGTAGLIVNHQPHAGFVAMYLALFGIANVAVGRWSLAGFFPLVTAGVVGVATSLFAVVPIIAESSWVMIAPENAFLRLKLPTLQRLGNLLIWSNVRTTWGIDYWAYLGIGLVVLALLGLWVGLRGRLGAYPRNAERRALALAILPCAILMFFAYNPVVRDVMFILFFASLLAAIGIEYLALSPRLGGRLVTLAFLVVLLDVSSTSIQPVARNDKQFMIDAGRYLERTAPGDRFIELTLDRDGSMATDIGPDAGPVSFYSTVSRIAGHHDMAATLVHNFAAASVELAEQELRAGGRLSNGTKSLLALFNVRRILCFGSFAIGCPASFADIVEEGPLGRIVRIDGAGPALFSRKLVELSPPGGLDKPMLSHEAFQKPSRDPVVTPLDQFLDQYLADAGLEPGSDIAQALPVRHLPSRMIGSGAADAVLHATLQRYDVGLQTVAATVDIDQPCYLQLSHPWYPATEIRVDGHVVEPLEGSLNLFVIPLETSGMHTVELRPVVTTIRAASTWVSLFFLALTLVLPLLTAMRRSRATASTAPHKPG